MFSLAPGLDCLGHVCGTPCPSQFVMALGRAMLSPWCLRCFFFFLRQCFLMPLELTDLVRLAGYQVLGVPQDPPLCFPSACVFINVGLGIKSSCLCSTHFTHCDNSADPENLLYSFSSLYNDDTEVSPNLGLLTLLNFINITKSF